jgi:hypothetical protein
VGSHGVQARHLTIGGFVSLEDILDDDLDDDLEDDLEDGGDEVGADEGDLSDDELAEDYAISDQNVRALSGERGGALMRPTILGSAVHLDGTPEESSGSLEKLLRGGAAIKVIIVQFANGRKLYIKP